MKKIISLFVLFLFIVSCAPAPIKPFEPAKIQFDPTPKYSIAEELEKLPKPEGIHRIFAKKKDENTYVVVGSASEADAVLLLPKEYAKVDAVVKLAITYKGTALEQEKLINTYIDQINALKELVILEQQKSNTYRQMWVDSENAFRQEQWQHDWDNRINRTAIYIVTIGSIIALLLLL